MNFGCRPTSDHVVSVISESGMVKNVGVAVGFVSPYVSVQTLFPLPVSFPKFVLQMSADVARCRQCHYITVIFGSGMVKMRG